MSDPELLKNIFYGYETQDRTVALRWIKHHFGRSLPAAALSRIYDEVQAYFSQRHEGVFGGQVTAGDGLFIAAMMETTRPAHVIEFGVASGYSSAFIITYAKAMGLPLDGTVLTSIDLVAATADGKLTGSFLRATYPELDQYWSLHTGVTSVDVMLDPERFLGTLPKGPILAFVDGGHNHPWPAMDLACLKSILPPDSWIIMQDYQMMERWLADCSLYGVPCPHPIRGVNLAVAHWPGSKLIGGQLTYNCAALRLDAKAEDLAKFAQTMLAYPYEIAFNREDLIQRIGVAGT